MIAFLQGQIVEGTDESIVVNVRGVGYEAHVSSYTRDEILGRPTVQLWIHTHVREDSLQLFGFISQAEKTLFLSLLKVNGIGPKVAMKILSAAPIHTIMQLIEGGDVKGLSQLPKVGKKTAEQIVLELKGKLVLAEGAVAANSFTARSDIVSALVNLGFKAQEVEKVVETMKPETDFEDGLRLGLSQLTGQI